MGGVVAGSATRYVPKELPSQDRTVLRQTALERKIAGAQLTSGEGTYAEPRDGSYKAKY